MPHLREGGRYLVARFHASFGETFLRGQRLELVRIAVHHGDRHFYTEFHFRDLDSGRSRLWTVDGSHDEATGRDLFAALFTAEDAPVEPAAQPPASTTASDARAASDEDEAAGAHNARPDPGERTMQDLTPIQELADFAAETRWEAIPAAVREYAKLVLLDTLGVILAGSAQPEVAAARARLTATGGRGATVYAPGWPETDPRTAALLNGLAGRSIELCEGHRYVSCQGAVQVLPAVLAGAEWLERSGRDALAALILGYEVAVRLGAALTARPLAHQNGQAPLLGAVAAGGRLRELTGAQMSTALGIGAILVLTPGYTNAVAGATALNVAGGMSGLAGALAPELALAGVVARPDGVGEAFAELVGDGFRPEALTDALGQRWEIARNYFRLRACCNPIYSALDALEEILREARPDPGAIERIDVATYRFAANMREPDPGNYFAAKYSLPHAAAALVLRGTAGYPAFTEAAVSDPAIAAFRRRVSVSEDPALTAQVPRLKPARVTVTFSDGRKVTRLRETARGDYQDPYREDEIRAKFRELAGLMLSPDIASRAEALVGRLDEVPRLGDLVAELRGHRTA